MSKTKTTIKLIKGSVTTPAGFKASGMWAGLKRSGKPDLSLIASDVPATGAAAFTKNSVKAAPLIVCQKHIRHKSIRAIITNSGNANCFTGAKGLRHAEQTAERIAKLMGIKVHEVMVSSTGIISKPLAYSKIHKAAPDLVAGLSIKGSTKSSKAILTTDTCIKEACTQIKIGGKTVTLGACAKGSGMIAPNMATMLAYVTTDAHISAPLLNKALKLATEQSFNRISVDGCMSTNDMVVVMANGLAGHKALTKTGKDFDLFCAALNAVCLDLAKKIVLDGEGATKFVEIHVEGAKSDAQAKTIALQVANSNLVKTAAFGSNPNWGRVAAAVGSLGITTITEKNLKIGFSPFDRKDIHIKIRLNLGKGTCTVYTSDLSYKYVKINGEYN